LKFIFFRVLKKKKNFAVLKQGDFKYFGLKKKTPPPPPNTKSMDMEQIKSAQKARTIRPALTSLPSDPAGKSGAVFGAPVCCSICFGVPHDVSCWR
jgi:hypothetical protein